MPVVGTPQFNSETQEQGLMNIEVTPQNYVISSVSMIAPSPDWFSGFSSFDVRDPATDGDTWYGAFSLVTFPWDAGVEDGDTYDMDNDPTTPEPEPVTLFTADTVPATNVFLNPEGNGVLPVLQWDCIQNGFSLETNELTVVSTTSSDVSTDETVSYSCEFVNLWTAARHPILYPSGQAHWSPPVMVGHDPGIFLWRTGDFASMGVSTVAEVRW